MGFIVEYVNTLKYANVEHTMIDMIAKFVHLGEPIPFTASLNDPEPHGVDLYNRAVNGEFGPIAAYEPITYTIEQLATIARQKRNELLKQCDWTQLNDIPEATQLLWQPYRQVLRDIPDSVGFPYNIDWPIEPIL
jgi:hypothetical protein